MKIKHRLQVILAIIFLSFSQLSLAATNLTVAIVPQYSPEQIYRAWLPVLNEITKLTGINFTVKLYDSIPEFEAAFLKGEPDFIYLNPYHAVMAHKAAGYEPIIRDANQRLSGILVVRKDSPVTSINQLDGATLAFPAPNAFGASLYMRALLTENAKIHFTPNYVQTHSNVYRQVIAGRVSAGGGIQQTFDKEPIDVQEQLRIIYSTPEAYPHPLSLHPRIQEKIRDKLQQAFIKLGTQPVFESLLKDIQIPTPSKAEYNEYAPLEKLGMERFLIIKKE
jgi:phosphonate transport system substrate-binding protein